MTEETEYHCSKCGSDFSGELSKKILSLQRVGEAWEAECPICGKMNLYKGA